MLDPVVLSSIFNPKYMKFTTCCHLKFVSSDFYNYSLKYQLALKHFNFNTTVEDEERWVNYGMVERRMKWSSKFLLFQTITKFCRNLKIVQRVLVDDEMLEPENFSNWLNLSWLVHMEFFSFTANPTTISVLNQLPCLKSVDFCELILDIGEIDENESPNTNETEYPKLNISCLKIGMPKFHFWRVVRLENLEKLIVSLSSPHKVLKFLQIVNLCPNLRAVEACLYGGLLDCYDEVSGLISTLESLPNFQELVFKLETGLSRLRDLLENCPDVSKYTRGISISSRTFEQEDFATIFRLKHLRKLNWFCGSFDHEFIFENLPSLEVVETSFDTMHYIHPGTGFFLVAKVFRLVHK